MPTPVVSIITPSYNQAQYLPATLESVAMQDYPHIEHIVVDGGSTDGSVAILEAWAHDHPISWQSQRDGGQADAINRGAALASGDIIAWLNSDDVYLDSSVISDVVAAFDRGADIVTGAGWYLFEDGSRDRRIHVYPKRVSYDVLRYVDWVLQPATFVRRNLFLACPLDVSLHYAFDWDLFIRLAKRGSFTAIDREIAGYRRHASGKTVSGGVGRQRELLEVVRRHSSRRSLPYAFLAPAVAAHRIGARLPLGLYAPVSRLADVYARVTQKATGGRGAQF